MRFKSIFQRRVPCHWRSRMELAIIIRKQNATQFLSTAVHFLAAVNSDIDQSMQVNESIRRQATDGKSHCPIKLLN